MKTPFIGKFLFLGGMIFSYPYWLVKKYLLGHNYKTLQEAKDNLKNPLDVHCFMWTQFKYIEDKIAADRWQPAQRTWDRKGGDCEDWAIFAMECLASDKVFVMSFYPRIGPGHATCVMNEGTGMGGDWVTMGTFGLRRVRGPIKKIPEKWYPDYTHFVIHDRYGNNTTVRRDG